MGSIDLTAYPRVSATVSSLVDLTGRDAVLTIARSGGSSPTAQAVSISAGSKPFTATASDFQRGCVLAGSNVSGRLGQWACSKDPNLYDAYSCSVYGTAPPATVKCQRSVTLN